MIEERVVFTGYIPRLVAMRARTLHISGIWYISESLGNLWISANLTNGKYTGCLLEYLSSIYDLESLYARRYIFCDANRIVAILSLLYPPSTVGPWNRGLIGIVSKTLSFEVDPYSSMLEFCRVLQELRSLKSKRSPVTASTPLTSPGLHS